MAFRTRRTLIVTDGVAHWTNCPVQLPEVMDIIAGRSRIGQYQQQNGRRGGRYFRLNGVEYELGGQTGSGVAALWAPILASAGISRSTNTYSLTDPHFASGETPAGNVVPISELDYYIDTQQWKGENLVSNVGFDFTASRRPFITADHYGNIFTGTSAVQSSRSTQSMPVVPASSSQPQSAPWQGSTILMDAAPISGLVMRKFTFSPGNKIDPRTSAGATFGYAPFLIGERDPGGVISMEAPLEAALAIEDKMLNEDSMVWSFTYQAAGAVGTWGLLTVSLGLRFTRGVSMMEENSVVKMDCAYEMDPDAQAFRIVVSQIV